MEFNKELFIRNFAPQINDEERETLNNTLMTDYTLDREEGPSDNEFHHGPMRWFTKAGYKPDIITDAANYLKAVESGKVNPGEISELFMDAEGDDAKTTLILMEQNPNLKVTIQLPIDEEFNDLEKAFIEAGMKVFRDCDSSNTKALQRFYASSEGRDFLDWVARLKKVED